MIKLIISDFARTILFPKDPTYDESLNELYNRFKLNSDFHFFKYFRVNDPLLDFFDSLRKRNRIDLWIFTTDRVQNDLALVPYIYIFSKILTPRDFDGMQKNEPKVFQDICTKFNFKPEEILFVDDTLANINAAKEVGLQTIQYTSVEQVISDYNKLINN